MTPDPTELAQRLRRHVERLAGEIGERHVWRPHALAAAAAHVTETWARAGHCVRDQRFLSAGVDVANLEIDPGDAAAAPAEDRSGGAAMGANDAPLVLGAHYDTVRGSPGADDNASGIAALLELARLLRGRVPPGRIRLVAFVNEEKPFDARGEMGSRRWANAARARGDAIAGMLSLEMVGYYSDRPGSQRYPRGLAWAYPDRADFVAFVANLRSRRLLAAAVDAFRRSSDFPVRRLAAPEALVPAIGRSDHRSFWLAGYPALMVTDTAFNRNPDYHGPGDLPDRLDYLRTARLVEGLAGMALRLIRTRF